MNVTSALSAASTVLAAGRVPHLRGKPGVGKSAIAYALAERFACPIVERRLSQMDPTDASGLPALDLDSGATRYLPPSWLPRKGPSLLFLDEFCTSAPLVRATFSQLLIPPHAMGEYRKPADVGILLASNDASHRAGASRLETNLQNRIVDIQVESDPAAWQAWAFAAGIDPLIIAFIHFRPALLNTFDPKIEGPFASERAWETVAALLAANPAADVELPLLIGTVGEGAAAEFTGFRRVYLSLPSIDEILRDPLGAPTSDDPAVLSALCANLLHHVEPHNADAAFAYLDRLPTEYGMWVALMIEQVKRPIIFAPAFRRFAEAHADAF